MSVRQLVARVVDTITGWGREGGYFATEADAETFHAELPTCCSARRWPSTARCGSTSASGGAPAVLGVLHQLVDDSMESILGLAKTEGMLFKYGSGTGTNLSALRSSKEKLAGGGTASGPVSFMKGFDAFAGVIKSGGKTRRAAKMVILNADHPDIVEFITLQGDEEKKAWALIDAGYDGAFNGEAYGSVFFQNSNNSVRVTDEFMQAVVEDRDWTPAPSRDEPDPWRPPGARAVPRDGRGGPPVRRPGDAVRHHHQRLAHLRRTADASTPATRAPSTCSSTTRPATWRRSTCMHFRNRGRQLRRRRLPPRGRA